MSDPQPPARTPQHPDTATPDNPPAQPIDTRPLYGPHPVERALRDSPPPPSLAAQHPAVIVRGSIERVEELQAIYLDQHRHYATIAPDLAGHPPRSEQQSWDARRERYQQWLATPGAFLFIAQHEQAIIGYALVSLGPGMQAWETGPRIGDLHDLAVATGQRGHGVGTRLLEAVKAELAAQGITELRLNVTAANEQARRLYERHGLQVITHIMLGPINSPRH